MKTRRLGKQGPFLSEIGFGAWAIAGPWRLGWGPRDDALAAKTIGTALDLGINWIDTAPAYGLGYGEEIVGRATSAHPGKFLVSTKCGYLWTDQGEMFLNCRPGNIRKECEASLDRLKSDCIDLYQIHGWDGTTRVEDSWGEMVRLKGEGKVRYIGLSNFPLHLLKRCSEIHSIDFVQVPYSMAYRNSESAVFPWCLETGVGVLAYSPLQSGILSGKFDKIRIAALPPNDWRIKADPAVYWFAHFYREPLFSRTIEFVKQAQKIARRSGKSMMELAIAFVLMNPAVTSALMGARNPDQLKENISGANWIIAEADMGEIDKLYQEHLDSYFALSAYFSRDSAG